MECGDGCAEWAHGNTFTLGALSHPKGLVPRSCSAVTEKLNFAFAYWEDLSQPCICYSIKIKHFPDYVSLLPLLSVSNESNVFSEFET